MTYKKLNTYKTNWEDCNMSIRCPYCGKDIYLDSQNEPNTCECGHTFLLSSSVYEIIKEENE